jgi:hypothetical protein
MEDIILERASLNKCPICDELLSTEIKEVNYKDKIIKVCAKHTIKEE